jgi:heat shock protein HtpX
VTATAEQPSSTRPLLAASVVPVAAFGLVVAALLFLGFGLLGLLVGLVLAAVAVWVRVHRLTSGGRDRVLADLGVVPVDPGVHAQLVNLAESISTTSGVPVPDLFILDDPAANLLVVGERPERAAMVVTTGMLDALDRIRLEAVVARGFAEVREGDLRAATIAVDAVARPAATLSRGGAGALLVRPFGGLLAAAYRSIAGSDHELVIDRAAVSLTRYPPGLIGALETMARTGTTIRRPDPLSAHLWMADPGAAVSGLAPRSPLELRIEALRLL